jgi:hypothetical protein
MDFNDVGWGGSKSASIKREISFLPVAAALTTLSSVRHLHALLRGLSHGRRVVGNHSLLDLALVELAKVMRLLVAAGKDKILSLGFVGLVLTFCPLGDVAHALKEVKEFKRFGKNLFSSLALFSLYSSLSLFLPLSINSALLSNNEWNGQLHV